MAGRRFSTWRWHRVRPKIGHNLPHKAAEASVDAAMAFV
jgi:hypothetical protein